jgi:hypothetical protein
MTFALIFAGRITQLAEAEFDVHDDFAWVDVSPFTPAPQPNWIATNTAGAWTFADPTPPPSTDPADLAAAELATRIAAGITITSTGTPALNGTYALDAISTAQIYQIGLFASQFGVFPSGATTQAYPDASGVPRMFSIDQFVAFLRAVAPLVSALTTQAAIMAHGGPPTWPTQAATIP